MEDFELRDALRGSKVPREMLSTPSRVESVSDSAFKSRLVAAAEAARAAELAKAQVTQAMSMARSVVVPGRVSRTTEGDRPAWASPVSRALPSMSRALPEPETSPHHLLVVSESLRESQRNSDALRHTIQVLQDEVKKLRQQAKDEGEARERTARRALEEQLAQDKELSVVSSELESARESLREREQEAGSLRMALERERRDHHDQLRDVQLKLDRALEELGDAEKRASSAEQAAKRVEKDVELSVMDARKAHAQVDALLKQVQSARDQLGVVERERDALKRDVSDAERRLADERAGHAEVTLELRNQVRAALSKEQELRERVSSVESEKREVEERLGRRLATAEDRVVELRDVENGKFRERLEAQIRVLENKVEDAEHRAGTLAEEVLRLRSDPLLKLASHPALDGRESPRSVRSSNLSEALATATSGGGAVDSDPTHRETYTRAVRGLERLRRSTTAQHPRATLGEWTGSDTAPVGRKLSYTDLAESQAPKHPGPATARKSQLDAALAGTKASKHERMSRSYAAGLKSA
jgi:hypothetical protein